MSLADFYRTDHWKSFRLVLINERVNAEGFVICAHCGQPIVKAYDCIAHHTVELTEENYRDYAISMNPELIELVHHRCHNIHHDRFGNKQQRQVFLVYGSPLSGKTSYVAEVMNEGDLVIDIDSIWQCVSGCDRHIKPARLKSVVFGVRDNLLDAVQYRRGRWLNAYVIGGYPFKRDRERLVDRLGAREIFIDTSRDECMSRAMNSENRNSKEWAKYVDDWWLQYSGGF